MTKEERLDNLELYLRDLYDSDIISLEKLEDLWTTCLAVVECGYWPREERENES